MEQSKYQQLYDMLYQIEISDESNIFNNVQAFKKEVVKTFKMDQSEYYKLRNKSNKKHCAICNKDVINYELHLKSNYHLVRAKGSQE